MQAPNYLHPEGLCADARCAYERQRAAVQAVRRSPNYSAVIAGIQAVSTWPRNQTTGEVEMKKTSHEQMEALQLLWTVANGHSGQCRYVAQFLLGLWNGPAYPFDLTNLRALDGELVDACLTVLEMDSCPAAEVHVLLGLPSENFAQLAQDWGIKPVAMGG